MAAHRGGIVNECGHSGRWDGDTSSRGWQADVIRANNVLAHVADLPGVVHRIRDLLAPNGIPVIEVPYLKDLMDHVEFDTIYHEHLCYFSLTALDHLFRKQHLEIVDAERQSLDAAA